jgi:hypothetical protein
MFEMMEGKNHQCLQSLLLIHPHPCHIYCQETSRRPMFEMTGGRKKPLLAKASETTTRICSLACASVVLLNFQGMHYDGLSYPISHSDPY